MSVITGPVRYVRRPEDKLAILAEAFEPGDDGVRRLAPSRCVDQSYLRRVITAALA